MRRCQRCGTWHLHMLWCRYGRGCSAYACLLTED